MSFPHINPTSTEAWKKLHLHANEFKKVHLRELFGTDASRFQHFSQSDGDFLFDYSKNLITRETLDLLNELAHECKLPDAI